MIRTTGDTGDMAAGGARPTLPVRTPAGRVRAGRDWLGGRWAGDIRGGLVASTTCLAFSISNGALVYSAVPQPMLVAGIVAGLVTTVVASFVFALLSTFRPVVALANVVTAAPLAAIVVAAAPSLARLPPGAAIATAYALVGVTTVTTGLALTLLGLARVGNLARFVPFPVMAGFTAVSGALFVLGSVRLSTGTALTLANLPRLAQPAALAFLVPTIALAVLITIAVRRLRHPLVLPGTVLAAAVAVNLAVPPGSTFFSEATLHAIFLAPRLGEAPGLPDLPLFSFGAANWSVVGSMLGSVAAYVLLVVVATLLTSNGLEAALNTDADYDRELRSQGLMCLLSAALGGFVGNSSVGATVAGVSTGAGGRRAGLTSCAVTLLALILGLPLLPYIPRPVLAALVMHLGIAILDAWCVRTRRTMPRGEWWLVIAIVAITVWFGLIPAIVAGVLGGCVLFVLDVSRISAVRRSYGLNERASPLVRSADALAALSRHGGAVRVIELQGMLFFGSAHAVLAHARRLLDEAPLLVVLDMTAVTGCDSSATAKLARMRKLLAARGVGFAVAGAEPGIAALLRSTGCLLAGDAVHATRDQALEAGEALVLERAAPAVTAVPLPQELMMAIGNRELADVLVAELKAAHYPSGAYLCRQGEASDTLIFIETGRVAVMVGAPGFETCVRIFGAHSIVGEQGFLLRKPRSASLQAQGDTAAWTLSRDVIERLEAERPALAIALLLYIFAIQSERLAFATRQAAILA